MSRYPKLPYETGGSKAVLVCNRVGNHPVAVRPDLPGNVILVHDVNDVGTSYEAAEKGLCAGLETRTGWPGQYVPASYRMPGRDELGRLEVDPDAVFFKRQTRTETYSPVIPFYWGNREVDGQCTPGESNLRRAEGAPPLVRDGQYIPEMPDSGVLFMLARRERVDAVRPFVFKDADVDKNMLAPEANLYAYARRLYMTHLELSYSVPRPSGQLLRDPTVAKWLDATKACARQPEPWSRVASSVR